MVSSKVGGWDKHAGTMPLGTLNYSQINCDRARSLCICGLPCPCCIVKNFISVQSIADMGYIDANNSFARQVECK